MARNQLAWSAALGVSIVACAGGVPGGNITASFDPTMDTMAAGDPTGPGDPTTGGMDDSMLTLSSGVEGSTSDAEESTSDTEEPTSGSPATCGDDMAEGAEACDGLDLLGEDCESQGFDAGTLGCAADCADYDTRACMSYSCGNGMLEGMETCDGIQLDGQTCASQGFDGGALGCEANCMSFNTTQCTEITCGNGVLEMGETCDGAALGGQTCGSQGFDGGALGCAAGCAGYDTSGCILACVEQDLGSALGSPVAMGTTVGQDEDIPQTCAAGGAVDYVLRFVAPAAASFQFDTYGSGYDTALSLHQTCAGPELACNDDAGGGLQSQLNLAMVAGQSILVVVSGYAGNTGSWTLNITQL